MTRIDGSKINFVRSNTKVLSSRGAEQVLRSTAAIQGPYGGGAVDHFPSGSPLVPYIGGGGGQRPGSRASGEPPSAFAASGRATQEPRRTKMLYSRAMCFLL